MDFVEIQKIVRWAKRNRIKTLTVDGLSFELQPRGEKPKAPAEAAKPAKEPPKVPSLEDINRFIYEDPEEVQT